MDLDMDMDSDMDTDVDMADILITILGYQYKGKQGSLSCIHPIHSSLCSRGQVANVRQLHPILHDLVNTTFFRLFRVNLKNPVCQGLGGVDPGGKCQSSLPSWCVGVVCLHSVLCHVRFFSRRRHVSSGTQYFHLLRWDSQSMPSSKDVAYHVSTSIQIRASSVLAFLARLRCISRVPFVSRLPSHISCSGL